MAERDVIVIGGSSGSFDVIKQVCAELPAGLDAAVLVVLHLRKDSRNLFASALDRLGELPVLTASDGMPIEKGKIYVGPAAHHMMVIGDTIRLGRGPRENLARPAIDPLFRSAAVSCGPRVIGVILSGYLNDGAAGLAAVKMCGGVTVVQNPADASAPDMPASALQSCDVDYRADTKDLTSLLLELIQEGAGAQTPVPPGLALEIDIALGRPCDAAKIAEIADPAAISCPSCGGVMSEVRGGEPLRYRCQVGHALTAQTIAQEQEEATDEAMRIALRIVEERITLLKRMAADDRGSGRLKSATSWEERLSEMELSADVIRRSLMRA